jgi:hypothetical protein
MKRFLRWSGLLLVLMMLSACATGAPFSEINPSLIPEAPETGRIFFYRPSGVGAAVIPNVVLNGETVGKAVGQGFFYIDRPAGEYTVVTSTEVKRKVSFVLENGQARYIRFKISMGFFAGHVYGELVDEDEALPELKKCKFIEEKKETDEEIPSKS